MLAKLLQSESSEHCYQRFALPKGRELMLVQPGGDAKKKEGYQFELNYEKEDVTPNH